MSSQDLQHDVEKQLAESQAKVSGTASGSPFPQSEKSTYTPNPELKTLRTYQGDVQQTIGEKKTSIASIALAEQISPKRAVFQKQREQAEQTHKESLIGKLFSFSVLPLVGGIGIMFGIIALAGAYYFMHSRNAPVKVTVAPHLIPQSTIDAVTLSQSSTIREQILNKLSADQKSFNGQAGSILSVQFSQNNAPLSETDFFQTLGPSAPNTLTRSMTTNYATGIYSGGSNQIFILLGTESYGQAYSGMLDWETTLQSDLSTLFPAQTFSTSTTPVWADDTFDNRDVRTLRNGKNGTIVLVYGFLDNSTLLITGNETAFQAIANKYISAKLVH